MPFAQERDRIQPRCRTPVQGNYPVKIRTPRHILIIRLSAIGDIVMASPLPSALRNRFPDARISWLCQPECADLVAHHPDVDQVIAWPRKEWQNLWRQGAVLELWQTYRKMSRALHAQKIDLVLDLQGLLKSGLLAHATGAKHRISLGGSEGSRYLMTQVVPRDKGDTSLIGSEYRYLAQQLGCNTDDFSMNVEAGSGAAASAAALVESQGISGKWMVICPFTTRPQKHWINAHWRDLAAKMIERWGFPVLMLGGPGDRAAAAELCSGTGIVNLVGKTSLLEATALIAGSVGLVGVDTGLTHIGHSKGIPTLALFGSTRPYTHTAQVSSKVLFRDMACAPCRRHPTCDGRFDCMRDLTPEAAITALASIRNHIL